MKPWPLLLSALLLAAPAAAQSNAEPYRASGTEPFWSLSIDSARITYRQVGGPALTVAKPRPIVGINGELYRSRGITVDITHVWCSDGMSDRVFADTVKLTVGRRQLSGCGGEILRTDAAPASPVAGTRWRIVAIDRQPFRSERPATVSFTNDRIEGRICNSFGGSYRLKRGTMTTTQVISTQMACAGPLGQAEAAFFRLIARPITVRSGVSQTLLLSDGRNSVTLQRVR